MHAALEADDRDVIARVPAAHAVGLEYRRAVSPLLAQQAVRIGLAFVDCQRRARLVATRRRRPGTRRAVHTAARGFGHPGRQRHSGHRPARRNVFGNPAGDLLPAGRLPDLEGAGLPAEAPADREIEVTRVVGDGFKVQRAVVESVAEDRPDELRLRMVRGVQLCETLSGIFVLQDSDYRLVGLAVGYTVSTGLEIEHLDVAADLLVDTLARFLPQRAGIDQFLHPRRDAIVFVPGILRQRVAHRVHDMGEGVEADHVGGAERCAFRATDQRTGQRIDGVKADAQALGMVQRGQHREHADTVGDEVGRVLRPHHALAQRGNEEALQLIKNAGIGAVAGDQLDQVHVTRRVEEMDAAEAVALLLRKYRGQLVDRQARGVAGEDGVFAQVGRDLAVEVGLPVHAFRNRLDDDVAIGEPVEVLVVVGRFDQVGVVLQRQRARLQLFQVGHRLQHIAVGITLLRSQFKQQDGDMGIDQVRGNLRTHHAGAEHGNLAHQQRGISGHGNLGWKR